MSLVARIDGLLPGWMTKAPRRAMGLLMSGFAAMQDGFAEIVVQARLAAIPGQVNLPGVPGLGGFDSCDALTMIARDRAVVEPLNVTPWDLAAMCRSWLDDAANQTGPFGVLDALAQQLGPTPPRMRLVTDNGTISSWYTREPDGARYLTRSDGAGFYLFPDGISAPDPTVAARFDWSSQNSNPATGDWNDHGRFFLILYAPFSLCTATDGTFQDWGTVGDLAATPGSPCAPGSPWAGTIGTNAPVELIERLRAVIVHRRAAGNPCAWIIVAFDPASFNPDGSSPAPAIGSAYPNGWWGFPSRYDSGTNTMIQTRNGTAEYWPGAPGGWAR